MIKKRSVLMIAVLLSSYFMVGLPATNASAQYEDANVTYNDFYQNLAPYGQWIEDPKFGYVWAPEVGADFRPYYTNGHWVMTDYGNTWVSEYAWGWACFHYGRWTFDEYYGWLWIPGQDWGPAWVCWREGDGFYGWAPMDPEYKFSKSSGDYRCPNDWWVFIPPQYIYTDNYYRYYSGPRGNSHIIKNTNFINNTYEFNHITYVGGPHTRQVENASHRPVQVYKLRSSPTLTTKVHNDEVKMYRPAQILQTSTINGQRVTPPNVVTAPQPIGAPQPTNSRQSATSDFKSDMPQKKTEAVGLHVNEAVKAKPKQNNVTNPYEYDINRPVNQPRPGETIPQQAAPMPAPKESAKTEIKRPQPPTDKAAAKPNRRPLPPNQKPAPPAKPTDDKEPRQAPASLTRPPQQATEIGKR